MGTTGLTGELIDRVFKFLNRLKEGQVVIVRDIAKKDPKSFVEAVKYIIDCGEQFEFNKDYSKVKRISDDRTLFDEYKKNKI